MRVGRRASYFSVVGLLDDPLPSPVEVIDAAERAARPIVVLDLSATNLNQPKSLEWLEQLAALADARGIRLRVVLPKGSKLRKAFDLLRFNRFMVVRESVRSALRFNGV